MRILTLVAIAAFVLLVAALVHAHDKHTAHPLSAAVLDVEGSARLSARSKGVKWTN
jgi:hypothetical protein